VETESSVDVDLLVLEVFAIYAKLYALTMAGAEETVNNATASTGNQSDGSFATKCHDDVMKQPSGPESASTAASSTSATFEAPLGMVCSKVVYAAKFVRFYYIEN